VVRFLEKDSTGNQDTSYLGLPGEEDPVDEWKEIDLEILSFRCVMLSGSGSSSMLLDRNIEPPSLAGNCQR
jgi:hypothetical protein